MAGYNKINGDYGGGKGGSTSVQNEALGRSPGRAVATRYDKRAANYRAGVVLAGLLLWLA